MNKGYSLIEVMVSLAFLGLVSVPLFMYFSATEQNELELFQRNQAAFAAAAAIEEISATPFSALAIGTTTTTDQDLPGMTTTLTLRYVRESDLAPVEDKTLIKVATARVAWLQRNKGQEVILSRAFYAGAAAEGKHLTPKVQNAKKK